MKKILATVVVILFVSLAFAPSLFADVETISEQQELVELTVEFYGLDKLESHGITLTRENADKIDDLFEEVKNDLNTVTSNSERISIFNDCIIELDKFGLLGENSIEDVKRITTNLYKEQIDGILKDADINYNCLIVGRTTNTNFFYPNSFFDLLANSIGKLVKPFLDLIKNEKLKLFIGLLIAILIELYYQNFLNPIQFGSSITYGQYDQPLDEPARITYADGWVWTLGKNGIIEFDGGHGKLGIIGKGFWGNVDDYYVGARNFCGIRLLGSFLIDGKRYAGSKYIGFASEVSIG